MNLQEMLDLCNSWRPKKDVEKATLQLYLLKEICECSLDGSNTLTINVIQLKDHVLIAIGESVHYRGYSTVQECLKEIKEFIKTNNFIWVENDDEYNICW